MPRPRVYVETTIPSYYFDERLDPEIVRKRVATRKWWSTVGGSVDLVTGSAVHEELLAGPGHRHSDWLGLIRNLPILSPDASVHAIMRTYLAHKLMPASGSADALHLALASHHACDLLVTWNCKHLANPNKLGHIRKVNAALGLSAPKIVTPSDLLGGEG